MKFTVVFLVYAEDGIEMVSGMVAIPPDAADHVYENDLQS